MFKVGHRVARGPLLPGRPPHIGVTSHRSFNDSAWPPAGRAPSPDAQGCSKPCAAHHRERRQDVDLPLRQRNVSKPRERVLRDPEIRGLGQALDAAAKLSLKFGAPCSNMLLGVRIAEALGALRSEIDFKQRIWIIPAHRTKANREHKLPLSDFTLELLGAANERAGKSLLLFPSPVDSKPIRRRSATRAVTRIASDNGVLDIGTHDLRRTGNRSWREGRC